MRFTENRSNEIKLLCQVVDFCDESIEFLFWFYYEIQDLVKRQLEEE